MSVLKNNHGFGIVAALVAMFIITVALLAILEGSRQAVAVSIATRNYNTATYLAQQVLEELKKNDGIATFGEFDKDFSTASPQTINGVEYTITQGDPVDLGDRTISVTVTISWEENGHSRSEEYTDYYYLAPGS